MSAVDNLDRIRTLMAAAEAESGRGEGASTLVAVTKTFGSEAIRPVLMHGHRVFGENRVQEAAAKWPQLRDEFEGIELHLIGPLQTNKVRDAVALFDVIETVDRDRLASALAAEMRRQGKAVRLLVQVNIGREPQKAGVAPDEAEAFIARCVTEHGLRVDGVMCIPPADQPAAPFFVALKTLADRCALPVVSMGMSGDFEEAVRLGATHVRVGSAIFGYR